ncbi:MAG: carboxypeptidase-like regulatory domain-containing protein, partial [Planctomycetota bacterium]|nr:carboxypeptidase-like regulatory domain-containing protein [Planctomycetota bacterium]
DQAPLSRLEVRTRRLTDEMGLAVVDHFQLYRRADEREAKQQKRSSAKDGAKRAAAGRGKGGARGGKGGGKGGGKAGGKGAGKAGAAKGGKKGAVASQLPTTFEAALLMPLTAPVTAQISVDPLPEGVIVLQKPATAALALRTVDRDGRPFTHPVRGQLELVDDESAAWSRVMLRKEQNEEVIEFPHVGLGLLLQASCRLDDDDFRWQSDAMQGPVAAGERVVVDLVVAPDAGMLFAKLVDDAGAPLGGVRPSFLISSRAGRLEGEEVITDVAGRFHLPYKVREGQVAPYRFEVRLGDAVPTRGFASPLAQLPVAKVTDLGELALGDLSEFARGVVVDDAGAPLAGASVQLERERISGQGEKQRANFVAEPFVRTKTADDGSFQLFGDFEPGRYRFRVEKAEHFRTFAAVSGGDDVRVEMTRKCRVVGTVLAPEWMNRKRVRVELRPVAVSTPPGEEVGQREDQLHDHQGKTYAFFDWVRPGTYDVLFRLQGFPDAFLVIDRLVLEPGQVGLHPRMRDLDLGAYIFRYEIYPVDENGQSVSVNRPQLAKITRRDGAQQYIGLVMKGGYGEVFNTAPQLEVVPMMGGYVADRQVLAPGRSELVFRSVPPVDVVLYGLSALAAELPVHVQLQRLESGGLPDALESYDGMSQRIAGWYAITRHGTGRLDELDTARVQVTAGGPHKVVVRVGPLKRNPQVVEMDAVDVKLVPGGEPQRIVVPYDIAALQQAIEAARAALEAAPGGGK